MEVVVKEVYYSYNNDYSKIEALKGVSFSVNKGSIHGILGKSGSGKSTLLQLIWGAIIPLQGYITANNYLTTTTKARRNIGFAFQFTDEYLLENTVKKELQILNKSNEKIISALNMVGLTNDYLNRKINTLSSGEKRLIDIAAALINSPSLLLLDEPSIGLDRINKFRLINLLKRINQKYNVTIIIASHDINFLNLLISDITILKEGKVLISGNKDDVFKKSSMLNKYDILLPDIIEFTNRVYKGKNIKLGNYEDVKDLIKAVYRNV